MFSLFSGKISEIVKSLSKRFYSFVENIYDNWPSTNLVIRINCFVETIIDLNWLKGDIIVKISWCHVQIIKISWAD